MIDTAISQTRLLVFTDLDGSLLDHHTYSAEPALNALNALKERNIPVIFNTSKTFPECRALADGLALSSPLVVENGSAIYYPQRDFKQPDSASSADGYWCEVLGSHHDTVAAALGDLAPHFQFLPLSNTSLEHICEATGLDAEAAEQARSRQYSEPLIWQDSESALIAFRNLLRWRQLNVLKGGRFIHVLGQTDKGRALHAVSERYIQQDGRQVVSIALGDSSNDIEMLAAADHAALIRSPAHPLPARDRLPGVLITEQPGSAGWAEAIQILLQKLGA